MPASPKQNYTATCTKSTNLDDNTNAAEQTEVEAENAEGRVNIAGTDKNEEKNTTIKIASDIDQLNKSIDEELNDDRLTVLEIPTTDSEVNLENITTKDTKQELVMKESSVEESLLQQQDQKQEKGIITTVNEIIEEETVALQKANLIQKTETKDVDLVMKAGALVLEEALLGQELDNEDILTVDSKTEPLEKPMFGTAEQEKDEIDNLDIMFVEEISDSLEEEVLGLDAQDEEIGDNSANIFSNEEGRASEEQKVLDLETDIDFIEELSASELLVEDKNDHVSTDFVDDETRASVEKEVLDIRAEVEDKIDSSSVEMFDEVTTESMGKEVLSLNAQVEDKNDSSSLEMFDVVTTVPVGLKAQVVDNIVSSSVESFNEETILSVGKDVLGSKAQVEDNIDSSSTVSVEKEVLGLKAQIDSSTIDIVEEEMTSLVQNEVLDLGAQDNVNVNKSSIELREEENTGSLEEKMLDQEVRIEETVDNSSFELFDEEMPSPLDKGVFHLDDPNKEKVEEEISAGLKAIVDAELLVEEKLDCVEEEMTTPVEKHVIQVDKHKIENPTVETIETQNISLVEKNILQLNEKDQDKVNTSTRNLFVENQNTPVVQECTTGLDTQTQKMFDISSVDLMMEDSESDLQQKMKESLASSNVAEIESSDARKTTENIASNLSEFPNERTEVLKQMTNNLLGEIDIVTDNVTVMVKANEDLAVTVDLESDSSEEKKSVTINKDVRSNTLDDELQKLNANAMHAPDKHSESHESSSGLLIDEKMEVDEIIEDSLENKAETNAAKDDERDSEDTSEISAATQIEISELPLDVAQIGEITANKKNEVTTVAQTLPVSQEDSDVVMIIESDEEEEANKNKAEDVLNNLQVLKPADCDTTVNNVLNSATDSPLLVESSPPARAEVDDKNNEDRIEDTYDEIYNNKECINHDCQHKHKQYYRAPLYALSHFKVQRKKVKTQYICVVCYDEMMDIYENYCGILQAKRPLLLEEIANPNVVEIIDSSDEEETETVDNEKTFSQPNLDLISAELDDCIKSVLTRVDIQKQLTWSKSILTMRIEKIRAETLEMNEQLGLMQKKADSMSSLLHNRAKIKLEELQPLDLNTGLPYRGIIEESGLPPLGKIEFPPIEVNGTYYAVKTKPIASWVPCRVLEQVDGNMCSQKNLKHYKVKFLKSPYQMIKTVSAKNLAYYDPPPVRLVIGSRVIAYFDSSSLASGLEKTCQSAFYPGIVAEPLKTNNKFRYLIFYDDGYTSYVQHKDVRLVCNANVESVWEDVHAGSREFIHKYLTQYSTDRQMVQTQKGHSMLTESNRKWYRARVVDVDCSLVKMQFEGGHNNEEWIYRGSLRLNPVFKQYQKKNQPNYRLSKRTEPYVRYVEDDDSNSSNQNQNRSVAKKSVSRQESTTPTNQTVANTSQTSQPPVVRHLNNSVIYVEDENKPKGKVVYYTAKRNLPPALYKPHQCNRKCPFQIPHNLSAYSPLSKPLLSGWERMIIRQKIKRNVSYRAPCGKICRNMKELRYYLRLTENTLNVDNFDFYPETNCLAEYVIESAIVSRRDISGGQEKMAIPLVNYYDGTMPPECQYSANRIPTEGVNLNTDEEFLVGCDCEDDCVDKSKCSCWQLTLAGAKFGNQHLPLDEVGYQYKRLYDHVPTGIYECNSRCKCKSNCLNRVVQHSLQMKLQVFKTSNRGWGLRCLNDIPRGSFVCVYAGHLLTEAKANEMGGLDAGDEYFAELDYIEVAEQIKQDYEAEVKLPREEDDAYEPEEEEDDDEFMPSKSFLLRSKNKNGGSRSNATAEEESQERQVKNFDPDADTVIDDSMRESAFRKLYGRKEACYVMDAKVTGNLGRYFNHSCSPNLFVQNVFVDTHDLRFPWVAFFAQTHIRAGTELTWNYNYEVGVVPGKVLFCQCGAPNCRLRLL